MILRGLEPKCFFSVFLLFLLKKCTFYYLSCNIYLVSVNRDSLAIFLRRKKHHRDLFALIRFQKADQVEIMLTVRDLSAFSVFQPTGRASFFGEAQHPFLHTRFGCVRTIFRPVPIRFSPRKNPTCALKRLQSDSSPRIPIGSYAAGGKRALSAEFLSVAGALATIVGVAAVSPIAAGFLSQYVIRGRFAKEICITISSFAYGLLLSRFDLQKASTLKLTIVFSMIARFFFIPALSHTVAIAGYALANLGATKTAAAAAAAAAVNAPETVKATAASLSLPSGVLSSLFLLSTSPMGFSPTTAMLSLHIHTTLFAILTSLTMLLFPLLPCISHYVSLWAHQSAFLNIGAILPKVAPPPSPLMLLRTTTVPFLVGLALIRLIPRRWGAIYGFIALPVAWICSLLLLASAISDVVAGSATGLAGSFGLCAGVAIMMLLLGRALASALLLDVRAKRTLILYLCTQGTVVGMAVSPNGFAAAPHVASALVGLAFATILGKLWSHVVIRTSTDVIL